MANPTTNYGFVLPTSSDLVTDLPADFDVALQGVDTRLKALQPGTTLGDLAYSSATANTNTRLAIGSTGNVLTVAGGVPTWATPASSGITQLASGSLSATVDLTSISSAYKNLTLIIRNFLPTATDGAAIAFRFNSDTNARYGMNNTGNATNIDFAGNERITTNDGQDSATSQSFIKLDLWDYANTATWKVFSCLTWTNNPTTSANANMRSLTGAYNQTSAISTINIFNNYGTTTTGTYVLYGVN